MLPFVKFGLSLFLLSSLWCALSVTASPLRRVRPSDATWPSVTEWEKLKKNVGGRLWPVKDPLSACRKNTKSKACFEALSLMKNPFYVQEQPGGTELSGWFKAWDSSLSRYVVEARTTQDVVAAINFARTKNLRLVVKGGAHSYLGQSNAPDSLLLWTKNMNKITLHNAFTPHDCPGKPVPAATIEAGANWLQAYDAITTRGRRYVQGGGCTTVGVAGFIQTGGFGEFSKRWGVASAGLLEAEVVTSDGAVLTTNACTNPDLFWALKGAGASFGVITKVTLQTHALPKYFGSAEMKIKARSDIAFKKLLKEFFIFYRSNLLNPNWGEKIVIRKNNSLEISMLCQSLTKEQMMVIWKPFSEWVQKQSGDLETSSSLTLSVVPAEKWWDYAYLTKTMPQSIKTDQRPKARKKFWWKNSNREVGLYIQGADSLWIPKKFLSGPSLDQLVQALFDASRLSPLELHFNKGLAGASKAVIEAAKKTPLNPVMIDAFALLITSKGEGKVYKNIKEHEPNLVRAQKSAKRVQKAMAVMRTLIPSGGTYNPQADFFGKNWQQRAWGPHYKRLLFLKKRYDPVGLFVGRHYVGSEFWSDDGFTKIQK